MNTTLVVMAAGLGSRYGGVKQIERIGPAGEILMEYAVYDALRAGFDHVVIILKPEMLQDVREQFGDHIERRTGIRIDYAFQEPSRFTEHYAIPAGRTKPFGTVHAVLCAKDVIHTPFVVINADDYYGRAAFETVAQELPQLADAQHATMVAYQLKNTVSAFGTVTRGVCCAENGVLRKVRETYKIRRCADGCIRDTSDGEDGPVLDPNALVSMNMWGYHHSILPVMERYFTEFLAKLEPDDIKSECLLPVMMDVLTARGAISTSVLRTEDKWFGLTYQQDKPGVVDALTKLHASGVYPPALWE